MQSDEREGSSLEQIQGFSSSENTSKTFFRARLRKEIRNYWEFFILLLFLIGLGGGYLIGISDLSNGYENEVEEKGANPQEATLTGQMIEQINPPGGYALPVAYGDIGPQLLAAGAINFTQYQQLYERAGQPLTEVQMTALLDGSDNQIIINQENAYFLLNFFWAFGLTNQNPVLTEGPMMQVGEDQIGRFASTGGWSIGTKPATELYASKVIILLSPEQQTRLEEVASAVYRPCCNNPTIFPDCNHGMAMLGLLELLASQDATLEQMFEAAKYANAYWFPQQTLEVALFHKLGQDLDFSKVDPRQVVGPNFSSGAGFQAVHQWLLEKGVLGGSSGGGNSCGV